MQGLLRVLKKDVRVICGAVEMEETEIEALRAFTLGTEFLGESMRGRQAQAVRFAGQEDGHAGH